MTVHPIRGHDAAVTNTHIGQELYTIRRQVLRVFGAGFDISGPGGTPVGYCEQKAFKLREDLRIYADRSKSRELLRMKTRQILDFSATYDVQLPTGEPLGSLRRKGLASTLIRDSWEVQDESGRLIARLLEDSTILALGRRFLPMAALLFPEKFELRRVTADGQQDTSSPPIATFRTHFNLLVYRLSITILAEDKALDDLMLLAIGCLIAAIEGRQSQD